MAAISSIPSYTVDHTKCRSNQLQDLRNHLGQIVAQTTQSIAQQSIEAMERVKGDKSYLNKAVWYPTDYAKACVATDQTKRKVFMQEKGHLQSGYLSNKYFSPITTGGVRKHWHWILKEGATPSDAIRIAQRGVSILDCGTVCTIAQYTALLNTLGEERFNRLFSHAHGMPLYIDYEDSLQQPMIYFVRFTDAAKSIDTSRENYRPIKQGQIVSFNNHIDYRQKHLNGMGGNYNVCCLSDKPGNQLFVGHGLPSEGLSESGMRTFLATEYNKNPGDDEMRASKGKLESAIISTEIGKRFERQTIQASDVPGLDTYSYQDFNLNLILDLLNLSSEEVSMDFVKKHSEGQESRFNIAIKHSKFFNLA